MTIPYARQSVDQADINAVVSVLESDWLTQGPTVSEFEDAVARYCGAAYAVAVSSGTAALHIAAIAADLGPGKILWTTPNTFVATANCALYCGADVDFVDIDPSDGNISISALAEKLESADRHGALPDVLAPVHFAGHPCDLDGINALAAEYGFSVIEDASHAIGARDLVAPIGCGNRSLMAIFSFHPVKIVTSAEGGMVVTDSETVRDRLMILRSHGITRNTNEFDAPADGPWAYQQVDLGFNYRLSDLHAALGLSQLGRIKNFIDLRNQIARRYDDAFESLPLTPLRPREGTYSSYHLYVVHLDDDAPISRRDLFDTLVAAGIRPQVHYIPVHTQPFYRQRGFGPNMFPRAEDHYRRALSLPLFPALSTDEQDHVIGTVTQALQ